MNQKSDEESDNFDYLSHLMNGYNNNKDIIEIDISSDSQSSDECFIIGLVQKSSSDSTKTIAKDLKSSEVKNELVKKEVDFEQNDSKYDVKNELMDKEFNSFGIKNEFSSNDKMKRELNPNLLIDSKTGDSKEMIDKMVYNFDDKSLIDVKPIDIKFKKINGNIVDNQLIDCNKIESKEMSVQTENIESHNLVEQSSSYQSSCCDISKTDRQILSAIGKIQSRKQQPKFELVFSLCNKLKNIYPEFSTRDSFLLAINEAKQKGLIQESSSIDGSIVYRGINSGFKFVASIRRRNSSKSDSSFSDISDSNIHSNKTSINNQSLVKTLITGNTDKRGNTNALNCENLLQSPPNSQLSFEGDFEDLGSLDDCHDFDDIDMSSSSVFADMEVDPKKLLNFPNDSNIIEDKPISMLFKSLPNSSVNHKKNREVVRKKTTLCHTNNDESDEECARIDYENWLTETLPRYSPFIAQKGDRVVYLRDAHKIYIDNEIQVLLESYKNFQCTDRQISDAIKTNDYIIYAIIIDVKFFQIRGIKFSVITLKCSLNDREFQFNVLYRPIRGICEFLVLEQFYKRSEDMNWRVNCEFRSLWKKSWWIGIIQNISVFNDKYPKSLFKSFQIKWNTNESGRLSPWDLFLVDHNRLPKNKANGVLATREDLLQSNYKPSVILNEWPLIEDIDCDLWRINHCKRIYNGIKAIEKNISKSIVSAFKNVNHKSVSYPINLQCIKDRLKNMYYRRLDSIKSDINYLRLNSKLYLKKIEFKNADDFIDLILLVVNDSKCVKEEHYLKHIKEYKHLFEAKFENTVDLNHKSFANHSLKSSPDKKMSKRSLPSFSSPPKMSSPPKASSPANSSSPTNSLISVKKKDHKKAVNKKRKIDLKSSESGQKSSISDEFLCKVTQDKRWKEESLKFIDELLKNEDTVAFREPVDVNQYPNYYIIITDPIDLSTIKANLKKDEHYMNPKQLREDFRLMFANAKIYTKNPKALIRQKTKLLTNLCEDRLREIIVDWDRVYAYEQKVKKGKNVREPISRNQLWGFGAQQYY